MRIMLTSARKIKFQMRNAGDTAWNELLSTTVLTVGDIYFVTASIGGDGQKLYINGALEDSDSGVTTHLKTTGWIYAHYGDDRDFGTPDIPDIYLDQLLFWYDKQLTDTEVNNMYVRI
jgi:hypothetical protein